MLAAAGVDESNATLVELIGRDAVRALQDGQLDMAFFIGGRESPIILFSSVEPSQRCANVDSVRV